MRDIIDWDKTPKQPDPNYVFSDEEWGYLYNIFDDKRVPEEIKSKIVETQFNLFMYLKKLEGESSRTLANIDVDSVIGSHTTYAKHIKFGETIYNKLAPLMERITNILQEKMDKCTTEKEFNKIMPDYLLLRGDVKAKMHGLLDKNYKLIVKREDIKTIEVEGGNRSENKGK